MLEKLGTVLMTMEPNDKASVHEALENLRVNVIVIVRPASQIMVPNSHRSEAPSDVGRYIPSRRRYAVGMDFSRTIEKVVVTAARKPNDYYFKVGKRVHHDLPFGFKGERSLSLVESRIESCVRLKSLRVCVLVSNSSDSKLRGYPAQGRAVGLQLAREQLSLFLFCREWYRLQCT